MNYVQRLEHWGDAHHPKWIDLLRIVLGIFLVFKGVEFANNMTAVTNMVKGQVPFSDFMTIALVHFILGAHLLGGVLLALGMLTRFACIIQIPILIGAIFISTALLKPFSEIFLALLILILLVYFAIIGSGPWSLDRAINQEERK
jgi:putative oxidoreductase